ncbi:hypothetical protein HDU93_005744 [Gonapodya sp. JEL0774]|nr:hypothetical protein HDU93_005744 [Gonapodya sp. JEL0774]
MPSPSADRDNSMDTARVPMLPLSDSTSSDRHFSGQIQNMAGRTASGAKKGAKAVYGGTTSLLKDFRAFVLRGHVVDLAIAVIMGAAFNAVVTAVVTDLFTPFIALATYQSSLPDSHVVLRPGANYTALGSRYNTLVQAKADGAPLIVPFGPLVKILRGHQITWNYGDFLNVLITFLITSLVMFGLFKLIILVYPVPHPTKQCPDCLGDYKIGAHVCMHCRYRFEEPERPEEKHRNIVSTAMHAIGRKSGSKEQSGNGSRGSSQTTVGGRSDDMV